MTSRYSLSTQYPTSLSLAVALVSVTLTFIPFRMSPEAIENNSVRVFNVAANEGLKDAKILTLGEDSNTNRTIWETVSTPEIQAGFERLEPGAWIPPHSHRTEEILLVYGGQGEAYDENGHIVELLPGSMVHIRRGARHAFRNVGTEPLWLIWSLPKKSNGEMFKFQQSYGKL